MLGRREGWQGVRVLIVWLARAGTNGFLVLAAVTVAVQRRCFNWRVEIVASCRGGEGLREMSVECRLASQVRLISDCDRDRGRDRGRRPKPQSDPCVRCALG